MSVSPTVPQLVQMLATLMLVSNMPMSATVVRLFRTVALRSQPPLATWPARLIKPNIVAAQLRSTSIIALLLSRLPAIFQLDGSRSRVTQTTFLTELWPSKSALLQAPRWSHASVHALAPASPSLALNSAANATAAIHSTTVPARPRVVATWHALATMLRHVAAPAESTSMNTVWAHGTSTRTYYQSCGANIIVVASLVATTVTVSSRKSKRRCQTA